MSKALCSSAAPDFTTSSASSIHLLHVSGYPNSRTKGAAAAADDNRSLLLQLARYCCPADHDFP